jgi:hypothetical protein
MNHRHEVRLVIHRHEVRLVMNHRHEVRLVSTTTIRPHWLENT